MFKRILIASFIALALAAPVYAQETIPNPIHDQVFSAQATNANQITIHYDNCTWPNITPSAGYSFVVSEKFVPLFSVPVTNGSISAHALIVNDVSIPITSASLTIAIKAPDGSESNASEVNGKYQFTYAQFFQANLTFFNRCFGVDQVAPTATPTGTIPPQTTQMPTATPQTTQMPTATPQATQMPIATPQATQMPIGLLSANTEIYLPIVANNDPPVITPDQPATPAPDRPAPYNPDINTISLIPSSPGLSGWTIEQDQHEGSDPALGVSSAHIADYWNPNGHYTDSYFEIGAQTVIYTDTQLAIAAMDRGRGYLAGKGYSPVASQIKGDDTTFYLRNFDSTGADGKPHPATEVRGFVRKGNIRFQIWYYVGRDRYSLADGLSLADRFIGHLH